MSPERYPSTISDASPLAQPLEFKLSGRTAPNRFLKAAMTERLATWDADNQRNRGIPTQELINVYQKWGEGGWGHILTGNLMLDYQQLEAPGNPIIPLDAPFAGPRFEGFKELARQAKAHGSLISGQMSHPGRQVASLMNPDPICASEVKLDAEFMGMSFAKPHAASHAELQTVIQQFTHSAEFLYKAGFDGIQLHGAHGYLLAQFLSKSTNQRVDQYGGSLRNRARLILEVAASIRQRVPASTGFILGIKLNSVEFQKGGFEADEARGVCELLEEANFDYVELSGGTYEDTAMTHTRDSTKRREAFFLEFAEKIVPGLRTTRTYITGGFQSLGGMVNALKTVDGVGLARGACHDFDLAKQILDGRVRGAIVPHVDPNDYGMMELIAGAQIRQVGKGQEPIAAWKKQVAREFLKDAKIWEEKMTSGDRHHSGYPDVVHALDPFPRERL